MKNAGDTRGRGPRFCDDCPGLPSLGLLQEEGVDVFPAAVNVSAITAKPTCRMRLCDSKLAGMTTSQIPRLAVLSVSLRKHPIRESLGRNRNDGGTDADGMKGCHKFADLRSQGCRQ